MRRIGSLSLERTILRGGRRRVTLVDVGRHGGIDLVRASAGGTLCEIGYSGAGVDTLLFELDQLLFDTTANRGMADVGQRISDGAEELSSDMCCAS